jgi:hypothetical protein
MTSLALVAYVATRLFFGQLLVQQLITPATWAGLSSNAMTGTVNSDPISVTSIHGISIVPVVTTIAASTAVGTFTLQGSNDGVNWVALPIASQAVNLGASTTATFGFDYSPIDMYYIRLVYTFSSVSGTAAMTGTWVGKGY